MKLTDTVRVKPDDIPEMIAQGWEIAPRHREPFEAQHHDAHGEVLMVRERGG